MDKNMIKIDDLLKQRLSNGEEKQRPGAWLQMRELLDKELPVTQAPAAAFNWRRMMGYLAGLALLATVSMGGYQVATRFNADNNTNQAVSQAVNGTGIATANKINTSANKTNTNPERSTTKIVSNTGANNKSNTQGTITANNQENKEIKQNTAHKPATSIAGGGTEVNKANSHNKAKHNQSGNGLSATSVAAQKSDARKLDVNNKSSYNNQADSKLVASNNTVGLNTGKGTGNNPAKGTLDNNTNQQSVKEQRNFGSGANSSKSLPVKTQLQSGTIDAPAASTAKLNNTNSKTGTANTPEATSTAATTKSVNNNSTVASANTNTANKQGQEPQQPAKEKILINKIETKEKYSRATGWKKDTIATGKVEWQREEVLAKVEEKPADNTVVPAASMSLKNNSEAHLVPLVDYKVSSKKANYEKVNRFAEMVQNAKIRMGTVRFYPGVIVGANTSLAGQNSLYGFQLGATGTLSLNDKWGILTELKYVQRLRKDSKLDDNYINNLDSSVSPSKQKLYSYDSTQHYFNYTNVSSIELPVAIKYSLKRLNLFGGGNFVYNLGVANVTEYSYKYSQETPAMSANINYEWVNGAPKITVTDFKSRFSIGYLIGAGYQLSPAMQLDIRLTQNVWDNAKSEGGKLISKDLYKMPSLQINMSYRFSNSKNKPMPAR